jgi:hypothetical protein
LKFLFSLNLSIKSAISPKVGGPPLLSDYPIRLKLTQLKSQIFNLDGEKVGDEVVVNLDDMYWESLNNESDYLLNNPLDVYVPKRDS